MKEQEIRSFHRPAEIRTEEGKQPVIVGYAVVWDSLSEVIYDKSLRKSFREIVRKGAFTRSLEKGDVRALVNHDKNQRLGRKSSGTLRLEEDDIGLGIEIDPPDTNLGRDIVTELARGDLDKMSFGFYCVTDEFRNTDDGIVREIYEADIFDVSIVDEPAYSETSVDVAFRRMEQQNNNQINQQILETQERFLRLVEAEISLAE